jgi:L-alanine-DL-glutamate epimerase-like enolase superfamily enzyme
MRITELTAHVLSSPIDPPQWRRFWGGVRRLLKRDLVLVVIDTADGRRGYAPAGASSSSMREFFTDSSHDSFASLLEDRVADHIAGLVIDSPTDIVTVVRRLDLPTKLESEVISVLDVAYHDLIGKETGTPVYDLLADRSVDPDPLPMYASSGLYMHPDGYAEQAMALEERGFSAYKYRPAGPVAADVATLRAIREAVGSDMDVMIDAHTWWKLSDRSYHFETVVSILEKFQAFNPYWVEEPLSPSYHDGYDRLTDETSVSIAGGESESSPRGLERLMNTDIDYLQGDVRHHDGFSGCWGLVEQCAERSTPTFVPHNFGTHLGLVANAHLVAASPAQPLLEYPVFGDDVGAMYPYPLASDVLKTELTIDNGCLTLPDKPGLGVAVDESVIKEYDYIEGPWTEFIYEDDTATDSQ